MLSLDELLNTSNKMYPRRGQGNYIITSSNVADIINKVHKDQERKIKLIKIRKILK